MTKPGGGGAGGGLAKDHTFSRFFFEPSPNQYNLNLNLRIRGGRVSVKPVQGREACLLEGREGLLGGRVWLCQNNQT